MTSQQTTETTEIFSLDFTIEDLLKDYAFEYPVYTLVSEKEDEISVSNRNSFATIQEVPLSNVSIEIEKNIAPLNKNLEVILDDLLREGTVDTLPPSPYQQNDTYEKKILLTYRKFVQALTNRSRILTLVYAYYLEELFEDLHDKSQKQKARRQISRHYISCARRVYRLYKEFSAQISNTLFTTLTHISNMGKEEIDILSPRGNVLPGGSN